MRRVPIEEARVSPPPHYLLKVLSPQPLLMLSFQEISKEACALIWLRCTHAGRHDHSGGRQEALPQAGRGAFGSQAAVELLENQARWQVAAAAQGRAHHCRCFCLEMGSDPLMSQMRHVLPRKWFRRLTQDAHSKFDLVVVNMLDQPWCAAKQEASPRAARSLLGALQVAQQEDNTTSTDKGLSQARHEHIQNFPAAITILEAATSQAPRLFRSPSMQSICRSWNHYTCST